MQAILFYALKTVSNNSNFKADKPKLHKAVTFHF